MREIALSYDNPEITDKAISRLDGQTYIQAQLLGKSAEWQKARSREIKSAAHVQVIAAALEDNNPMFADKYLQKYSDQMEAGDILKVRSHITKGVDLQVDTNVGAEVFARYA